MKKFYYSPELEVTLLLAEDVITASNDPDLDNEIEIDPDDSFWN